MKLSDFLLFPDIRLKSDDELTITSFSNVPVEDPAVLDILTQLVAADSTDEVRFILTLAYQQYTDGQLDLNIGPFYDIES